MWHCCVMYVRVVYCEVGLCNVWEGGGLCGRVV